MMTFYQSQTYTQCHLPMRVIKVNSEVDESYPLLLIQLVISTTIMLVNDILSLSANRHTQIILNYSNEQQTPSKCWSMYVQYCQLRWCGVLYHCDSTSRGGGSFILANLANNHDSPCAWRLISGNNNVCGNNKHISAKYTKQTNYLTLLLNWRHSLPINQDSEGFLYIANILISEGLPA